MSGIQIETDKFGFKSLKRPRTFETWERGFEDIEQEGSPVWMEIRELHELSPEDLESISSGEILWEEVRSTEDRPGLPSLSYLAWLARLEGTSPGELLDRVCIARGRELEAEDED